MIDHRISRRGRRALFLAALLIGAARWPALAPGATVNVFNSAGIQFGGDAGWSSQSGVARLDNGRMIERTLTLPEIGPAARVTTQLNIWASDDPWDRAGSIQLVTPAGPVELHKFITGFGGTTSHQQDVTDLAPYLRTGQVKIRAFVDTWVQKAWKIGFSLSIDSGASAPAPGWNQYLFNDQDVRAGEFASTNNRRRTFVQVPANVERVSLNYLASGHASDGSGGDEFTQRVHKIYIDGALVKSFTPWRTDGRNFRNVNPYSGRWGDVWSSDLHRAGWIPGDDVDPYVFDDLTQYLTPGRHIIEFEIEGIQPDTAGEGYGYWRASSYLSGYLREPDADFNADGFVDGADLVAWQQGLGRTGQVAAVDGDANGDGSVNAADLTAWNQQFGRGIARSAAAVPEPAVGGMARLLAVGMLAAARSRRRGRSIWHLPLRGGSILSRR